MKEDFLHYIWKYKKFDLSDLKTVKNEKLHILNAGQYTQLQGPDFFNAQIEIDGQKWAGNVEIHLKSSDWYIHHHQNDTNYDSIILHVVWEHDVDVYRLNNMAVPVLELKNYVSIATLESYQRLVAKKSWIYCETQIAEIPDFIFKNWQERLFFERLERKATTVETLLHHVEQDWESVLFCMLAKNFGLNTNGESFLEIAKKISFQIIRKERNEVENIEALFFGFAGLLNCEREDNYFKDLKFRFYYLINKYQLDATITENVTFFKHRPDNFPTIRFSQLANLIHDQNNLFSAVIEAKSVNEIYTVFNIGVSNYWKTHFQFDNISPEKDKKLSKSFIDLLIINTIIPLKFAFAKSKSLEISQDLIEILNKVKPENNGIINKFKSFGIHAQDAFETQSLLQLKNEYCNKAKCMDCAVGVELLKN